METALYIALASFLATGTLSEPGQVFGGLKSLASRLPGWLYLPLWGCAKCQAGQIALLWQVWQYAHGGGFDAAFVVVAISGAYALQRIDELIEAIIHK